MTTIYSQPTAANPRTHLLAIQSPVKRQRNPGLGLGLLAAALLTGQAFGGPGPVVRIDPATPQEVMIGGTYSFTLWFKNSGDAPGYGPYIDADRRRT